MKTLIIRTIAVAGMMVLTGMFYTLQAQPEKTPGEKIETFKISFLTTELDLTREEAEKFWPVYNEFQNNLEELRKEFKEKHKAFNLDAMSDEEIRNFVDDLLIMQQRELDLRKKFHADLKSILPIRKVAKYYEAERKFKKILLEKLGERKRSDPPYHR